MKRFLFIIFVLSFALEVPAQTLSWGYNVSGQLGFRTPGVNAVPVPQIASALPDAIGIEGGETAMYFLKANGTVASSGSNNWGLLGTGSFLQPASVPVSVIDLTDVVQVAGGEFSGMALKADGTVWCWGGNWFGQLGIYEYQFPDGRRETPTPQQSLISDVVQISAGQDHAVVLRSDGTVWAWGLAWSGATGDEPTETMGVPRKVGRRVSQFKNLIGVAAGDDFSAALKDDGTVWVWGENRATYGDGTLGVVTSFPKSNPRRVPGLDDVVQIAAGMEHLLALKRDGTLWAWGQNSAPAGAGQLNDYRNIYRGSSRRPPVLVPTQIAGISDVVEVKAGFLFSMARKRNGSVWAWGGIYSGEIGTGAIITNSFYWAIPSPQQTLTGTGNALIGSGLRSGFAGKPVIQTPVGFGVKHYGANVQMLFLNVTTAGTTSYTAIDPTETNLNVPTGYAIQPNEPAYNVSTTAQTSGETEVCLSVNEYNRIEFPLLKILHAEGTNWIDRTFSSDYIRRRVCARVDSPSSFVIAKVGGGK